MFDYYGYLRVLIFTGIVLAASLFVCCRFFYRKIKRINSYYYTDVLVDVVSFAALIVSSFVLFCMYDLAFVSGKARSCIETTASSLTLGDFNRWFSGESEAQALADSLPDEINGRGYCFNEAKSAYDYVYYVGSSRHRVTFTIKVDEDGSNTLEWT